MTITTKFTEIFGVEHPIAQGGMQWVGARGTVNEGIKIVETAGRSWA